MVQARDELFVKLALRQGVFSQQEAVGFLLRYREEGAGEGVGQWLVAEGVLPEEQAAQIRDAIAHRAEGHVDNVRRRVPKRRAKAGGAGGHAHAGGHGNHPVHHLHHHHAPRGKVMSPTQQVLFIGSGVVAIGLLIFLVFEFQKETKSPETASPTSVPNTQESPAQDSAKSLIGANDSVGDSNQTAPQWSDQEIESMTSRINDAISLARNHMGDGRPGRGIATIRKRTKELGDTLPPAVQALADAEIADLQTIVDEAYADALTELREAKANGDESAIQNAYFDIEETCGAEYVTKAKAAVQ
jgi:hypothetical protein